MSLITFPHTEKQTRSGKLVVRFTMRQNGDVSGDAEWFHFAYTNLKSWAAGVVKLVPDTDMEAIIMSRVLGFIALRLPFVDAAESPWDRLCTSSVTMVFDKWDVERSCDVALYGIIDDVAPVDVFCPAQVAVREILANKDH